MTAADADFKDKYLAEMVARHRAKPWRLQSWVSQPALFSKDGSRSTRFHGQSFDPNEYNLVEGGWSHDHCPYCWVTVSDLSDPDYISEAYTDGNDWVCPDCYAKYLASTNVA